MLSIMTTTESARVFSGSCVGKQDSSLYVFVDSLKQIDNITIAYLGIQGTHDSINKMVFEPAVTLGGSYVPLYGGVQRDNNEGEHYKELYVAFYDMDLASKEKLIKGAYIGKLKPKGKLLFSLEDGFMLEHIITSRPFPYNSTSWFDKIIFDIDEVFDIWNDYIATNAVPRDMNGIIDNIEGLFSKIEKINKIKPFSVDWIGVLIHLLKTNRILIDKKHLIDDRYTTLFNVIKGFNYSFVTQWLYSFNVYSINIASNIE